MIKLKQFIKYNLGRNRERKQIQFKPQLKDYTKQESIKLQTQQLRQKFERVTPTSTFTQIINDPNAKLGNRFDVPTHKFNKKIKEVYKERIDIKLLDAPYEGDMDFLNASKSHLNDQKEQIQFEEKFQQQIFRTKETKRIIEQKSVNVNNYLPNKDKDKEYLEYQEAKKSLKNKKINNMMVMNRNNQSLELLIQSGLFNNPQNIKSLIKELEGGKSKQNLLPQHENEIESTQKSIVQSDDNKLADSLDQIGPEQLKQRGKIVQFLQRFESQHEKDKQSCLEDLNLLKNIRKYEQQLFLKRYDAINFRFKGRVSFAYFHEPELISYIKNQSIDPKQLLMVFRQNQTKLSKFQKPIITPAVMANMYSKTCLYNFPETDTNNRMNMLNDPLFQNLERRTFQNVAKLSDTDYCSAVWAYASNHQYEQGVLKQRLYNKINEVILQQLNERIYKLNDDDLGLVLRGVSKLHLGKDPIKWGEIVTFLGKRISNIDNFYAVESVVQFLLCLPQNQHIRQVAALSLPKFASFQWQQVSTLLVFSELCGLLLKKEAVSKNLEFRNQIKTLIETKNQEICKILPQYSINKLSQFLLVLSQTQSSLSLTKTVNLCKKLAVQNIKAQKQELKEYTLNNLIGNLALIDIQTYEQGKKSKITLLERSVQAEPVSRIWRKLCLKCLIPFQPIPYNSSLYFVYHDLASLTFSQMFQISDSNLAKLLENLTTTKYKNQILHDRIVTKILKTPLVPEGLKVQAQTSPFSEVKKYVLIVNSYTITKRNNELMQDALKIVLSETYFQFLLQDTPFALIKFITGVLSVEGNIKIDIQKNRKIFTILNSRIGPFIKTNTFIEEQIAAIAYSAVLISNYNVFQSLINHQFIFQNPPAQFIVAFCTYLRDLQIKSDSLKSQKMFRIAQSSFYKYTHKQIQYTESCIGSPLAYSEVYARLAEIIKQKHLNKQIIERSWLIEVPEQKIVYFISTYDHLMAVYNQNEHQLDQNENVVNYSLYGVWRLYEKLYEIKGWQIRLRVSFLQGK